MMSSARKRKAITVKSYFGAILFVMKNDEIESSVLNIQSVKDVLIFPLTVEIFQHIIDITNKNQGL